MKIAMSKMSPDELNALYIEAKHNKMINEREEPYWERDDYDISIDPNFNEPWTDEDEDEAGLEEFEENRRRKIAEQNEY